MMSLVSGSIYKLLQKSNLTNYLILFILILLLFRTFLLTTGIPMLGDYVPNNINYAYYLQYTWNEVEHLGMPNIILFHYPFIIFSTLLYILLGVSLAAKVYIILPFILSCFFMFYLLNSIKKVNGFYFPYFFASLIFSIKPTLLGPF